MELNAEKLGTFISQVDKRNSKGELNESSLRGISISKVFIDSHANLVGVDLKGYKIVEPGDFVYIPVTSRNGEKISIARNDSKYPILVSSAYIVFRVTNSNLSSDYLMVVFSSPEFDRYSRYNSWGSAREVFSWEDFCDTVIFVPELKTQIKIANELSVLNKRKSIIDEENKALINLTKVFINRSISKGNEKKRFDEIADLFDTLRKPLSGIQRDSMKNKIYPYYGAASKMDYVDNYLFDGIYGLVAEDGSCMDENGFPVLQYVFGKFWVNNHAHVFKGKGCFSTELVYLLLMQTEVREIITGAVQQKINQENLKSLLITVPDKTDLNEINLVCEKAFNCLRINMLEIEEIERLIDLNVKQVF